MTKYIIYGYRINDVIVCICFRVCHWVYFFVCFILHVIMYVICPVVLSLNICDIDKRVIICRWMCLCMLCVLLWLRNYVSLYLWLCVIVCHCKLLSVSLCMVVCVCECNVWGIMFMLKYSQLHPFFLCRHNPHLI